MLALVAAAVLLRPDTVRAELRRADASYAQLDPYPIQAPGYNLSDVLSAYQSIIDDHGPIPGAEAGLGKCLFLFGRYREAANAFRLAGERYRWRYDEASVYADVSRAINRQTKPLVVWQLRHVPATDRWVAVLSSPPTESGWGESGCKLTVYQWHRGTNRVDQIGKSLDAGDFWAGEFSTLYLVRLSSHDREWRLLFFRQGSGDCSPFDVRILSVVPTGLKTIQSFDATEGAWARGPSATHGLLVWIGPAWHVAWGDLYEWTGQGFTFANRRFPRFFKVDDDPDSNYTYWMTRAAVLDIQGQFGRAVFAWKRARRACRIALRHTDLDDPEHVSAVFGNMRENLKEITRRLGWLSRHRYNHALLYRPIDWGLQVPPHKLGHADDQ